MKHLIWFLYLVGEGYTNRARTCIKHEHGFIFIPHCHKNNKDIRDNHYWGWSNNTTKIRQHISDNHYWGWSNNTTTIR